jgi:hypothetical protein
VLLTQALKGLLQPLIALEALRPQNQSSASLVAKSLLNSFYGAFSRIMNSCAFARSCTPQGH